MEKAIKSFSEITKSGQLVLIENPLVKDDLAVCTGIIETLKYAITDSSGNKCRSLGHVRGKGIQYQLAVDEGCTGDEMTKEYHFSSDFGGSYTFKEYDDPTSWNIRLIDEGHPKYNPEMSKFGNKIDKMINMMAGIFDDQNSNKSEDQLFGEFMGMMSEELGSDLSVNSDSRKNSRKNSKKK